MANANIYIFERLLKDLETHVTSLTCLLQKTSNIACNAWGIHRVIYETSRYDLLDNLSKDVRSLNFLSQQVFMVASNACSTNTAIYETFQNWCRELNQL